MLLNGEQMLSDLGITDENYRFYVKEDDLMLYYELHYKDTLLFAVEHSRVHKSAVYESDFDTSEKFYDYLYEEKIRADVERIGRRLICLVEINGVIIF